MHPRLRPRLRYELNIHTNDTKRRPFCRRTKLYRSRCTCRHSQHNSRRCPQPRPSLQIQTKHTKHNRYRNTRSNHKHNVSRPLSRQRGSRPTPTRELPTPKGTSRSTNTNTKRLFIYSTLRQGPTFRRLRLRSNTMQQQYNYKYRSHRRRHVPTIRTTRSKRLSKQATNSRLRLQHERRNPHRKDLPFSTSTIQNLRLLILTISSTISQHNNERFRLKRHASPMRRINRTRLRNKRFYRKLPSHLPTGLCNTKTNWNRPTTNLPTRSRSISPPRLRSTTYFTKYDIQHISNQTNRQRSNHRRRRRRLLYPIQWSPQPQYNGNLVFLCTRETSTINEYPHYLFKGP